MWKVDKPFLGNWRPIGPNQTFRTSELFLVSEAPRQAQRCWWGADLGYLTNPLSSQNCERPSSHSCAFRAEPHTSTLLLPVQWEHGNIFLAIRPQFSRAHCYVNTTLTSEYLQVSPWQVIFFARQYFMAYISTQTLLENFLLKQGQASEGRTILLRKALQDSSLMVTNNMVYNTDAMIQNRLLLTG